MSLSCWVIGCRQLHRRMSLSCWGIGCRQLHRLMSLSCWVIGCRQLHRRMSLSCWVIGCRQSQLPFSVPALTGNGQVLVRFSGCCLRQVRPTEGAQQRYFPAVTLQNDSCAKPFPLRFSRINRQTKQQEKRIQGYSQQNDNSITPSCFDKLLVSI